MQWIVSGRERLGLPVGEHGRHEIGFRWPTTVDRRQSDASPFGHILHSQAVVAPFLQKLGGRDENTLCSISRTGPTPP